MIELNFTKIFIDILKRFNSKRHDHDIRYILNNLTRKHVIDAMNTIFVKDEQSGDFKTVNLFVLKERPQPLETVEFEDYGICLNVVEITDDVVKLELKDFIGDFIGNYSRSPFVESIDIKIISGKESRDRFVEKHIKIRSGMFITRDFSKPPYIVKDFGLIPQMIFDPFNKMR